MSEPKDFRRRLANRIVHHACCAMPSSRQVWANAMRAEVQNITDDRLLIEPVH